MNTLFQTFKHFFFPPEEKKPYKHILVTIHGFGKKRSQEMIHIKEWGEQENWNVVVFDMFEHEVETVPDYEVWMSRAKAKVEELLEQGYTVDLLGFSMGGVIAGYLASILPIRRLVLLAPAFEYVSLEIATRLFTMSANSMLYDEEQEFIHDLKARVLPPEYFPQFMELVRKYRHHIADVTCPVLFIHGSADEIIAVKSSRYAYQKIKHSHKKLFVVEGGSHQMMLDNSCNVEVFALIRLFLDEEIVKVEKIDYNTSEQLDDQE